MEPKKIEDLPQEVQIPVIVREYFAQGQTIVRLGKRVEALEQRLQRLYLILAVAAGSGVLAGSSLVKILGG